MSHDSGQLGAGSTLLAATAALSVAIAQGKTAQQLELLSALFDILADNLALLALHAPSGDSPEASQNSAGSPSPPVIELH